MKNKFILIELNPRNEIRADVNLTIESLGITEIENIIDFGGIRLKKDSVKVSYDRTGNILIGMDLLAQMDIHIGQSRILGKTIFLACPYDSMNPDYLKMLHEHFDL